MEQINMEKNIYSSRILSLLEDTARYAGSLLAPAEVFGLWPRIFSPKKRFSCPEVLKPTGETSNLIFFKVPSVCNQTLKNCVSLSLKAITIYFY